MSNLRDKRGGAQDPETKPNNGEAPLPEGLRRDRKGPLDNDTGRARDKEIDKPTHARSSIDQKLMNKLKQIKGKAKQVVAEVTGDEALRREGKREQEKAKEETPKEPFENLNELT